MKRYLIGGPMNNTMVDNDSLTIEVQEQVPFNVYMAVGKVVPIKPTTPVAAIDGRVGVYELQPDGSYLWSGWRI